MPIILGLALSLTLIISTNAGFITPDIVPEIVPKPAEVLPESPPKPANDPPSPPPYHPSPPETPGGGETGGEDKPENDIAETLSNILDAITSIISPVDDGGTSTVTSLPTAAYPCLSAQNLFHSCASRASGSYAAALSTQVCIAGFPCVIEPSGPDTAVASMQSSCLCPQGTSAKAAGLFDGYLGSCKDYVQAQTQLATRSGLAIATAVCTSATTTAAGTITPTITPANSTMASQTGSSSTSAATVLSPMIISGGSRHQMWWAAIVLVGLGWGGCYLAEGRDSIFSCDNSSERTRNAV